MKLDFGTTITGIRYTLRAFILVTNPINVLDLMFEGLDILREIDASQDKRTLERDFARVKEFYSDLKQRVNPFLSIVEGYLAREYANAEQLKTAQKELLRRLDGLRYTAPSGSVIEKTLRILSGVSRGDQGSIDELVHLQTGHNQENWLLPKMFGDDILRVLRQRAIRLTRLPMRPYEFDPSKLNILALHEGRIEAYHLPTERIGDIIQHSGAQRGIEPIVLGGHNEEGIIFLDKAGLQVPPPQDKVESRSSGRIYVPSSLSANTETSLELVITKTVKIKGHANSMNPIEVNGRIIDFDAADARIAYDIERGKRAFKLPKEIFPYTVSRVDGKILVNTRPGNSVFYNLKSRRNAFVLETTNLSYVNEFEGDLLVLAGDFRTFYSLRSGRAVARSSREVLWKIINNGRQNLVMDIKDRRTFYEFPSGNVAFQLPKRVHLVQGEREFDDTLLVLADDTRTIYDLRTGEKVSELPYRMDNVKIAHQGRTFILCNYPLENGFCVNHPSFFDVVSGKKVFSFPPGVSVGLHHSLIPAFKGDFVTCHQTYPSMWANDPGFVNTYIFFRLEYKKSN